MNKFFVVSVFLFYSLPFAFGDDGQNYSVLNDGFMSRMAATRSPGEIQFNIAPRFEGRSNNEKYITNLALEYGISSRWEIGARFPFLSKNGSSGPYGNGAHLFYNAISSVSYDFLLTTGVEYLSLIEDLNDQEEEHSFFRPQIQAQKTWGRYFMNLEFIYERKRIRRGNSMPHTGLISTLTAGYATDGGRWFTEIQQRSLGEEKGALLGIGKTWVRNESFQFGVGGSYGTSSLVPKFQLFAQLSWDIDIFQDTVSQLR